MADFPWESVGFIKLCAEVGGVSQNFYGSRQGWFCRSRWKYGFVKLENKSNFLCKSEGVVKFSAGRGRIGQTLYGREWECSNFLQELVQFSWGASRNGQVCVAAGGTTHNYSRSGWNWPKFILEWTGLVRIPLEQERRRIKKLLHTPLLWASKGPTQGPQNWTN